MNGTPCSAARGRRTCDLPERSSGQIQAQHHLRLACDRQATTAVEFAVCALAMVLMVVGFAEFGRLVWTVEVLQEAAAEGARCMGLAANSCAVSGTYNSANTTTNYIVSLATARGVVIDRRRWSR